MPKQLSMVEAQLQGFIKKLNSAAQSGQKQVAGLRARAADAALHWITSHDDRIAAFRKSVSGTPVEHALETVLKLLKAEQAPAGKAAPVKAATRKAAVKKAVAGKAPAKKGAARKTPAKAARKKPST